MRVSPTSLHKAEASKKHLGIKGIANNAVSNNIAGPTSRRSIHHCPIQLNI